MNFTAPNIAILLAIIIAVPYLIIVLRRASGQNFPFVKALNPFYTREMMESDNLKESISPILNEIETKKVAKFINYWSDKFENNQLTVEDVESLNAWTAAGETSQVNGILAIHPEGRKMFSLINEEIKLKEEALVVEEAV